MRLEAEEKLKLGTKALRVIEGLTIEGMVLVDEKKNSFIHKFSHIALADCKNPHEDWHKELDEAEAALVEAGIISKEVIGE